MPGGVFWLDKASHSSDVVYGEVRKALSMPDVMLSVGLLRQTKDNRAGYNEPLACHIVHWGALMLLYICNLLIYRWALCCRTSSSSVRAEADLGWSCHQSFRLWR